jgi:hypothetical protein
MFGVKVIPYPPSGFGCVSTENNKLCNLSGSLWYHDPLHNETLPIKNLLNDYSFYIETQLELKCWEGTSYKITYVNVLNEALIDQNGNFSAEVRAYIGNDNPVLKFRLIPKRSGYIVNEIDACESFNMKNFDIAKDEEGFIFQRIDTYAYNYTITYSSGNSAKDWLIYWQIMMLKVRESDKVPFNYYSNYIAKGFSNPNNCKENLCTMPCFGGDSVIIYDSNYLIARYPNAWSIYHEMTHVYHFKIYYNSSGSYPPGTVNHSFCDENSEETIFIEGLADWGGTYLSLPKYKDDIPEVWIECKPIGDHKYELECHDVCKDPDNYKRSEAHVMSFLYDVFDPIQLDACYEGGKLDGVCVDGIEKNPYYLYQLDSIITLGFWNGIDGFIHLWDQLNNDPYVCKLLVVNHLEDLVCPEF